MVNEQAERAAGVFRGKVDLSANATRHPHNARIGCHAWTITAGASEVRLRGKACEAAKAAGDRNQRLVDVVAALPTHP
jgi:hypothetical protein